MADQGLAIYGDHSDGEFRRLTGAINAAHDGAAITVYYRGQPFAQITPVPEAS
jgi:hypothetical protein